MTLWWQAIQKLFSPICWCDFDELIGAQGYFKTFVILHQFLQEQILDNTQDILLSGISYIYHSSYSAWSPFVF